MREQGRAARAALVVLAALFATACGGRAASAGEGAAGESAGAERSRGTAERAADPLSVSGLLGSLSQHEIRGALEPRMPRFARCFAQRSELVPWISGSFAIDFRVGLDGKVVRATPRQSELGDRVVERCLLGVAEATAFPEPHGGEAEFSWSLEAPADPEIRPADAYPALERAMPTLLAAVAPCGASTLHVTGYVDENGRVVAAGAAAPDQPSREQLDCVAQALLSVTLVSPGSYAAKFSTVLP